MSFPVCSSRGDSTRFCGRFNKAIIPLALVGYEMIIANSALRASLAINHLIPNKREWNNCFIKNAHKISLNLPDFNNLVRTNRKRQGTSAIHMSHVYQNCQRANGLRGTQRQFLENICSEDDLRSRIFGTFVVKFLASLPLLNGIIAHF